LEHIGRHSGKDIGERGFTLIEVLISLLIVAFGIVAVMEGLSASSRLVFKSKQYQDVGELAEREMELVLLQMDKVRDLGEGGEVTYTREWDDVTYRCRLRVSPYELSAEGGEGKGGRIPFYKVELEVTAGGGNGEEPHSFTLQTSFAKEKIVDWSSKNVAGPAGRGGIHFGGGSGGLEHGGPGFPLPFPFPKGRR